MSLTGGFGLGNLGRVVALNLGVWENRSLASVARLSSGLRVQNAADDPSGLAIAEGLRAKVNGYDQASDNVQTAHNALVVADGALQTVSDLLQRLRSLSVEANDDLLSADDRNDIQTESQQLQVAINTIAESTNFNGLFLLDGSTSVPPTAPIVADGTFTTPTVVSFNNAPVGGPWTFSPTDAFGQSSIVATTYEEANFTNQPPPSGSSQFAFVSGKSGLITQSIAGFTAGASYSLTFNLGQVENITANPTAQQIGVLIDGKQIAAYDPSPPDWTAPNWSIITTPTFIPGAGAHTISFQGLNYPSANGGSPVGSILDNVQLNAAPMLVGSSLQVQSGADEGSALSVQLPTVFTSNLEISTDSVTSTTSSATFEGHIDAALDALDAARATLGAQMVSLQYQAQNDQTASVNFTGSESNIRDANIAQTTTAFAQAQILSSIGTSVLTNITRIAASVERLFE